MFAGIVGAFLFSLVGGIIWFVIWQLGYLSAISGIIGVICAIKGYAIFAKKESVKGVIISIIVTLIVMVIAWYFCFSMDVYNWYQDGYAEGYIDFTITFGEAFRNAYLFLEDSEGYIKDLIIGLAFCVIGGIGYVMSAIKRVKAEKEAAEIEAQTVETEPEYRTQSYYNGEPEYRDSSWDENK